MRWRDIKQNKVSKNKPTKDKKDLINYASQGDKIKAFITDSFLLAMPIFYVVIYFIMGGREGFSENLVQGWSFILVPLGLVTSLFYTISGQTPGMKAHEIKVISNETGKKPNIISSILRFVFFNITFFSVIGLLINFFREDRRGLHDLLSGTSVVDEK
jgi:uncharacterized RDD family membrane protein YckC